VRPFHDRGAQARRGTGRHPNAAVGYDEGIRIAAELRDGKPDIGVVVLSLSWPARNAHPEWMMRAEPER
jgi:hypothetical protein